MTLTEDHETTGSTLSVEPTVVINLKPLIGVDRVHVLPMIYLEQVADGELPLTDHPEVMRGIVRDWLNRVRADG